MSLNLRMMHDKITQEAWRWNMNLFMAEHIGGFMEETWQVHGLSGWTVTWSGTKPWSRKVCERPMLNVSDALKLIRSAWLCLFFFSFLSSAHGILYTSQSRCHQWEAHRATTSGIISTGRFCRTFGWDPKGQSYVVCLQAGALGKRLEKAPHPVPSRAFDVAMGIGKWLGQNLSLLAAVGFP